MEQLTQFNDGKTFDRERAAINLLALNSQQALVPVFSRLASEGCLVSYGVLIDEGTKESVADALMLAELGACKVRLAFFNGKVLTGYIKTVDQDSFYQPRLQYYVLFDGEQEQVLSTKQIKDVCYLA